MTQPTQHIGEGDAADFYYLRGGQQRAHEIYEHLNACPRCSRFYDAWRAKERAGQREAIAS